MTMIKRLIKFLYFGLGFGLIGAFLGVLAGAGFALAIKLIASVWWLDVYDHFIRNMAQAGSAIGLAIGLLAAFDHVIEEKEKA